MSEQDWVKKDIGTPQDYYENIILDGRDFAVISGCEPPPDGLSQNVMTAFKIQGPGEYDGIAYRTKQPSSAALSTRLAFAVNDDRPNFGMFVRADDTAQDGGYRIYLNQNSDLYLSQKTFPSGWAGMFHSTNSGYGQAEYKKWVGLRMDVETLGDSTIVQVFMRKDAGNIHTDEAGWERVMNFMHLNGNTTFTKIDDIYYPGQQSTYGGRLYATPTKSGYAGFLFMGGDYNHPVGVTSARIIT